MGVLLLEFRCESGHLNSKLYFLPQQLRSPMNLCVLNRQNGLQPSKVGLSEGVISLEIKCELDYLHGELYFLLQQLR